MKSLLLGESASPEHIGRIVAAIESVDGIDRVIHQRTLHVGPEEVVVAAKVVRLIESAPPAFSSGSPRSARKR